jgi:hypothetical protein
MNRRTKKKLYRRAEKKLETFRAQNQDPRSYYAIACKERHLLTPKERSVYIAEQEKWMRLVNATLDEIQTEEMKDAYAVLQPVKDPNGFRLFRAAEEILGKFDYAHFPYEDNRGYFEDADGYKLLRYLLVQHCRKLGEANATVDRWDIVAAGYEQCIDLTIDTTTPEYKIFEKALYKRVLATIKERK